MTRILYFNFLSLTLHQPFMGMQRHDFEIITCLKFHVNYFEAFRIDM